MAVTESVRSLWQSESGSGVPMFVSRKFRIRSRSENSSGTPSVPQKLVCMLALFGAVLSVVTPALCAPRDCTPTNSLSSGECHGMPVEKETGASAPSSPGHCCDLSQNPPPATHASLSQVLDLHLVTLYVLHIAAPFVKVSDNFGARSFVNSLPHDLQSLICTFLI